MNLRKVAASLFLALTVAVLPVGFITATSLASTPAFAQSGPDEMVTPEVAPSPAPTPAEEPPDAGVGSVLGPDFSRDLAAFVADPTNFELGARLILHAVMNGAWGLLVSLLIVFSVVGLRKFTPEESKFGQWLRSKMGGLTSNFTLSLGLAFTTQFAAGAPFSAALVIKAISIALQAAGGWAIYKNVREAVDEAKAKKAGAAAAADPKPTVDK